MKSIIPEELCEKVVTGQITSDMVLSLYEKSKTQRGKKKDETLKIANILSKHIGKWLVK